MTQKKTAELSPESIARAERQRLAVEEGARAMVDIGQQAIAVRKNMERLRALREAKEAKEAREAEEARTSAPVPPTAKKKRKRAFSS